MKLFSPHKKKFYTSHGLGIGNFKCSFELFQLLALSSRGLFAYENDCKVDLLPANFDPKLVVAAENTLMQPLAGTLVRHLMNLGSPWNFYYALRDNDHKHLYLAKFHRGGLQGLVKARCMAWDPKHEMYDRDFVRMHSQKYL